MPVCSAILMVTAKQGPQRVVFVRHGVAMDPVEVDFGWPGAPCVPVSGEGRLHLRLTRILVLLLLAGLTVSSAQAKVVVDPVSKNRLVISGQDQIDCLDPVSGQVMWTRTIEGIREAKISPVSKSLWLVIQAQSITALRPVDGVRPWTWKLNNPVVWGPQVAADQALIWVALASSKSGPDQDSWSDFGRSMCRARCHRARAPGLPSEHQESPFGPS